jgi:Family of unknown function (DUF6326)
VTEVKVDREIGDRRMKFFTLWIFVTFNYVYADVVTLFDKSVVTTLSQTALFGAAVLVETAIAMVLLSRVLKYRANRWANIIVGIINTVAVVASLVVATPALYYAFFGVIEIATTLVIIWYAWTWRASPERSA